MFPRRREPDENEDAGFPDDTRNWRSDADQRRRLAAELERVKQAADTYRRMEAVWLEILSHYAAEARRMKWTDR